VKARRILIVNPNTNRQVTDWLAEEARRVAASGVTIAAVNASSGLAAIQTPAEVEQAGRCVVEVIAACPGIDAAVIAAFGDPGLQQARASCAVPVIGLGEAGLRAAAVGGRRFSVVTLGAAMQAPIRSRIAEYGFERQCTGLTILPIGIGEMIADRDRHRAAITTAVRACFDRERAEAVLLAALPSRGSPTASRRNWGRPCSTGLQRACTRRSEWGECLSSPGRCACHACDRRPRRRRGRTAPNRCNRCHRRPADR
jgi:Asp/Glu/hydantoin racemase